MTRGLLSLLGNVLIYRNRTLRQLILTCYGKVMLRKEQENNEEFDREMIVRFIEELKVKSNLKVLTI